MVDPDIRWASILEGASDPQITIGMQLSGEGAVPNPRVSVPGDAPTQ